MNNYDIESKDFALSPLGIHLLRNKFNYKTINFDDIYKATLTRSVETRNVGLALTVGILLMAFAVYNAVGVYENFNDPSIRHIYIESIILPFLPLLTGLYCIYIAVKKVPLLAIELNNNKKHKLGLQDIINAGQIDVLKTYLKDKLSSKFYDSATL